ncbi:TRM11 family SAM-dependent methyltransferase [Aquihabitans sp. McL0605]|uniref:TRM11 family SAM-dependent methyltransferase n=1 Tax=Aquihabitans sp. McL0605 TaxID=3415671 RepID=UPI003CF39840
MPECPDPLDILAHTPAPKLTHYLFRYPAKFHPPVARALIERYSEPGGTIYDPFIGSGTLLVEAASAGRNGIGSDIDPLAVAIAQVKTHVFRPAQLRQSAAALTAALAGLERRTGGYERLQWQDIAETTYERRASSLRAWIPAIPNLHHWFRRYVILELAQMKRALAEIDVPESHRAFLSIVFASIIRNASNADPVPVSGLEVTSHMRARDAAGRVVNPHALLRDALARSLKAATDFAEAAKAGTSQEVYLHDATRPATHVHSPVDTVITSPPYYGAVDYYRRHQLEMFWLGLTKTQADRLSLLPQYIGRPKIPMRDPLLKQDTPAGPEVARWLEHLTKINTKSGLSFRHYMIAMSRVFIALAPVLTAGSPAVFVVGDSTWHGTRLPTQQLFAELAGRAFHLDEVLSYPTKNRYMSYTRHNGADIGAEYVLAFRRSTVPTP